MGWKKHDLSSKAGELEPKLIKKAPEPQNNFFSASTPHH